MELNKENMRKIRFLIAFAILLYLGVKNIDVVAGAAGIVWGLLFPFILGCAIAFVLNVPMKFIEHQLFEKRKKKNKTLEKLARPVSLVLSLLFVLAIILIVVLVVAPELATTVVSVVKRVEASIPELQKWAAHTFRPDSPLLTWIDSIKFNPQEILNSALNVLKNGMNNFLSSTVSGIMDLVNTAMNFGIGLIFSFYILLQKERLSVQVKKALYALLPKATYEYTIHVCQIANKTFASFITGQCIEAVILGCMFFVAMTIFRFPYAMLVGVLIAFTALIPVFGAFIGCGVGFLLILIVSPIKALLFLILFLALQQIEGNLIYPHVVGNSVGLPPIWVLVAVTLGGSLMGVVGMLIFIPLVSVLYSLFREWVNHRLKDRP